MTDKLYWKVKRYVKENNITIGDLAKAIGYSRCHFSSVINESVKSEEVEKHLMAFFRKHKTWSK